MSRVSLASGAPWLATGAVALISWLAPPNPASALVISSTVGDNVGSENTVTSTTGPSVTNSGTFTTHYGGSITDSASVDLTTGQFKAFSSNSATETAGGIAAAALRDNLTILGTWTGTIPVSITLSVHGVFSGVGNPIAVEGLGFLDAATNGGRDQANIQVNLGYNGTSAFVHS